MKHQYDWSKLDAGWTQLGGVLIRQTDQGSIVVAALEQWSPRPGDDPVWVEFKTAAKAQLAKCCIGMYDWRKLDTGWSYEPNTGCGGTLRSSDGSAVTLEYLEAGRDECGKFTRDARAQLAKCRVDSPEVNHKREATRGWRNPVSIYQDDWPDRG